MVVRRMHPWRGAILVGLLLNPATTSEAQDIRRGTPPLVQAVTIEGTDELSASSLLEQLATRPTRCRGILLAPICLFTDGAVVTERHRIDEEEVRRDELRIRVISFREGFREAAVTSAIRDRDDGVEVGFHVVEGPPTLIRSFEVHQTEDLLAPRYIDAVHFPREGEPLSLNAIARGVEELFEVLEDRGHLDARLTDSLDISRETRRARVVVTIEPGPRAVVGEFEIIGNREIEDETILRGLHLEKGDVITRPLIRQSRSALHASNLFHEADIRVPEVVDSVKVLRIEVREAPPRRGRIGAGVNTLEFGQVEGRFSHYNWLGGGRQLDLRAAVGNLLAPQLTGRLFFRDILPDELAGIDESPFRSPTWQLSADFQQPAFRATANRLGVGLFANRRVIPGVAVDQGYGAEVSLTRRLAFRIPATAAYRFEVTSVEAGDVFFCVNFGTCEPTVIQALRGRSILSPVSLSFHADRSDHPLGPSSGYRIRLDAEHASGITGSDFRYHRLSGEVSYYLPMLGPPRHVLAAHVRAGWVRPLAGTATALGLDEEDPGLLHPRKRFFAGGARSVRGFPENQLGPRILTIPRDQLIADDRCAASEVNDGTCDPVVAPVGAFAPRPIGGTSVVEGSIEYRMPIGAATLAMFVDGALIGGRLGAFVQDATGAITPGLGVRFGSPAGPIRIDVGFQPRMVTDLPVVTEAEVLDEPGLRQLVQLQEMRRFDPLEGEGTLGRILGRLTLHFSIGEAF